MFVLPRSWQKMKVNTCVVFAVVVVVVAVGGCCSSCSCCCFLWCFWRVSASGAGAIKCYGCQCISASGAGGAAGVGIVVLVSLQQNETRPIS